MKRVDPGPWLFAVSLFAFGCTQHGGRTSVSTLENTAPASCGKWAFENPQPSFQDESKTYSFQELEMTVEGQTCPGGRVANISIAESGQSEAAAEATCCFSSEKDNVTISSCQVTGALSSSDKAVEQVAAISSLTLSPSGNTLTGPGGVSLTRTEACDADVTNPREIEAARLAIASTSNNNNHDNPAIIAALSQLPNGLQCTQPIPTNCAATPANLTRNWFGMTRACLVDYAKNQGCLKNFCGHWHIAEGLFQNASWGIPVPIPST